jgi:hypothetical protein
VPTAPAARRVAGSASRWAGRTVARVLLWTAVAALVIVAAGDAAGRWRLVPSPPRTAETPYSVNDMVVVVPVPVQQLRTGDVVIIRNKHEHALLRLEKIVDSEGPQVRFAGDPPDRVRKLGGTAWRVRASVPYAGRALRLFAGPLQGGLLVLAGLVLIIHAELRRSRELSRAPEPAAPTSAAA